VISRTAWRIRYSCLGPRNIAIPIAGCNGASVPCFAPKCEEVAKDDWSRQRRCSDLMHAGRVRADLPIRPTRKKRHPIAGLVDARPRSQALLALQLDAGHLAHLERLSLASEAWVSRPMASTAVVVRRRKLYSGGKVAPRGLLGSPQMQPRVPSAEPVRPTCHLRMGNIIVGKKGAALCTCRSAEPTSPAVSGSISERDHGRQRQQLRLAAGHHGDAAAPSEDRA
jgi:hypothetical protein